MEDGVTMAVCLALGGKDNVKTAVAAYEKMRYDRVRAAQKTGETTRNTWHKADFDKIKANPDSMKLKREPWLLDHDAEQHAWENYQRTVDALHGNKPAHDGSDGGMLVEDRTMSAHDSVQNGLVPEIVDPQAHL